MIRLTPAQRLRAMRTQEAQALAEFIDRIYCANEGGKKNPGFMEALSLWKQLCKHWRDVRRTQWTRDG